MQTGDAFGEMLRAFVRDGEGLEIVERDDGFLTASQLGPSHYLAPFRKWLPAERQAARLVRGRVLDIGAGGGRVALHFQERGLDVVSIDVSPGAVEVMRERGVRDASTRSDPSSASSTRSSCSGTTSACSAARAKRRGSCASCKVS